MSRLSLPILATLAAALAFPSLTAHAQASASAPALYAEMAAPEGSFSSSVPALFPAPAPAQSPSARRPPAAAPQGGGPFSGLAVGVKIGLAGIGFDVATPLIRQRLNLRGGASFFSYSPSTITTDNLDVNGTITLQNAGVMIDFFPFHGWFRISGGATVYNNTYLTAALSVPTGQSFSVGGTTYYSEPYNAVTNPAGPIAGNGTFTFGGNKVAPRVTIGTGNMLPAKGRITFETEIGFQYFSQPVVSYSITGTGCQNYNAGVYSNCGPIPQANITSEQNMLQDDLKDLRFFPILSVGLGFKIH